MKIAKRTVTLETVLGSTRRNREWVDRYRRMVEDPDEKARRSKQLCVCCHYGIRIGGAAMTETACALCNTRISSGSTNIEILCLDCAYKHRLCCYCGSDIDLKNRRKL